MNDLRPLIANVQDEESLLALLGKGLGWPIKEFGAATRRQPQIAEGVNFAGGEVTVRRLRPLDSEDKRPVFLVDFGEDRYLRRDLRALLRSLRAYEKGSAEVGASGVNDTLFVVAQNCWEDVRFVLFRPREGAQPEIRSFGWSDPNAPGRTVLEKNLFGLAWGESDWQKAFDVEGLTEAFYDAFEKTFKQVRTQVVGAKDQDAAHEWTQLLFNRILFIAFIQRMGWLKAPGKPVGNYLQDLYKGDRGEFRTFLGVVRALVEELDQQPEHPSKGKFKAVLGDVPYLNGGLFSPDPIDTPGIDLPDEAFEAILGEPNGLFCRYNFTVTESTPLDLEVAVDPEMLGKVFERLVNDRHQEGKYYTPRPIVSFMVDEAIKGYLVEREVCTLEQAALLVDKGELRDKEAGIHIDADQMKPIREALLSVRAVDPACGSGAYLLGLLQKLFELVDRLNVEEKTGRELYQLKLRLLQHCVYGVDLDPVAVSIARLRLWLSLVVENRVDKRPDGTVEPPQPLPNLDFRVEHGDSLAAPVAPLQPDIFRDEQIRRFHALKLEYSQSTSERRAKLAPEIVKIREEIASGQNHTGGLMALSEKPFDWTVEFAEVFQSGDSGRGGFDIVLANPPFVNSGELLRSVGRDYKDSLVAAYPDTGTGTADLLVFFFDRALQLLRSGGQLAFITSNKWLKAGYGRKLRCHLAKSSTIHDLVDFHDGKVFQEAIAFPVITVAQKTKSDRQCCYTSVPSPERHAQQPSPSEYRERFGHGLALGALSESGEWRLETGAGIDRLAKMRERGIPLSEYLQGRIYYGIKTGLNEVKVGSDGKIYGKAVPPGVKVVRKEGVFVIDGKKRAELISEDAKSAEIIKPLVSGSSIWRWRIDQQDRWLIFTRRGTNIDTYPAIKRHLLRFREKLEPRPRDWDDTKGEWTGRKPGSYRWYEIQDEIAYWREFEHQKLICPDLSVETRWTLSPPRGIYVKYRLYL